MELKRTAAIDEVKREQINEMVSKLEELQKIEQQYVASCVEGREVRCR